MTCFFSCDWGTTSFRLRRVNAATGGVLAERRDPSGIRSLLSRCQPGDQAGREEACASFLRAQLLSLANDEVGSLHGVPVVVSGMASSSIGWRELPYARAPIDLDGSSLARECFELSLGEQAKGRVWLISGVQTDSDIMRGEETEILGLFSDGRHPELARNGVVVLPGTHSKHVRLRSRQITGFRTYMTGELFEALSTHTVLRSSVGPTFGVSADLSDPEARAAFTAGVRSAREVGLAASLFQTRVRTVLREVSPSVNHWFLSGLLIGAEIADLAMREPDAPILLAAPASVSDAYGLAFEVLGLQRRVTVVPAEEIALASVRGHQAFLKQARWSVSAPTAAFSGRPGVSTKATSGPLAPPNA